MAVSKSSNGIAGGHTGEGDEPISGGRGRQETKSTRAALKASTAFTSASSQAGAAPTAGAASAASAGPTSGTSSTQSSRIASRPARAVGAEMRSASEEEGRTAPLGYTDRKYSFNALLAAGFLGYVLGRLISR